MSPPSLGERFAARARARLSPSGPVVVAVSGGLDSTVLLHLLRFHEGVPPVKAVVAHFDHRLRAESAGDARWVRGLARAWGLDCESGAAAYTPSGEEEARDLRYAFLDSVRRRVGASVILTAHHADDQAETVLFRILRGTGLAGLRGMPTAGRSGRVRLLLPFWRRELEGYAEAWGLTWRTDSTNEDRTPARNRIRHELLPLAEAGVAPAARRSLVRLARHAARDRAAWEAAEELLLDPVVRGRDGGRIILARPALLAYHGAIRARLLRALALDLGVVLDEAGTRVAMAFTSRGPSGGEAHLAGGLRLRRSFDEIELLRGGADAGPPGAWLEIPGPDAGSAAVPHGHGLEVEWGPSVSAAERREAFQVDGLAFPLVLRGWRPGDRIRLGYGTKRVAKLLAEARVARRERRTTLVLVDGTGRVLWVPGVARSVEALPSPGHGDFQIGIDDAHSE
jgi:tRNA(Ile)-lysidine synthase